MTNQAVIDAWADMKPWVEGTLPGLVKNEPLPNTTQSVPPTDACSIYNYSGADSGLSWGADGDALVTLSSLRTTTFDGVTIQPAKFTDKTTVLLPIKFSTLMVGGHYSYSQPCACWDFGKKVSTSSSGGDGNVSETVIDNTICYRATFNGVLSLLDVTVNGTPAVSTKPNSGYWSGSLVRQVESSAAKEIAMSLKNIFASSDFTRELMSLLNAQLSKASGASRKVVDLYLVGQEEQGCFASFALEDGQMRGVDRYGALYGGNYAYANDSGLRFEITGGHNLSLSLTPSQLSGEETVTIDHEALGAVKLRFHTR